MASFVKMWCSKPKFIDELIDATREAEKYRDAEYRAVVVIQSWYRGVRVKALIKHLHVAASIIQRCFRAYRARKIYRQRLKDAVDRMEFKYYFKMATIIQKFWRGYWTRKYVFNYYARKRYLQGLETKNKFVRQRLTEVEQNLLKEAKQVQEEAEKVKLQGKAIKLHYLVSTQQIPGVYNSPFKRFSDEMENHLRNVKVQPYERPLSVSYTNDVAGRTVVLPPIQNKLQGPFRSLAEVHAQRGKQVKLSLRADTAFTSVDDSRHFMKQIEKNLRVQEKPFQPFTRRALLYERTLHGTTSFSRIPYGTKHFREADHDLDVHDKPFQSVVSKVEVFDKIGSSY